MAKASDLKVCFVLNHMPGPGAGGLEGQVHDVCTGLLERGVAVHVTCRPSLYMPAEDLPLGKHVNAVTVALTAEEIDNPFLGMWRTSQALAEAEDWNSYDVVHLQSHYGYHTALRLARMPTSRPALVTTFHLTAIGGMARLGELGFAQEPDLHQTQPAAVMESTVAGLSDRSIAVSRQVHEDLTSGYGVAPGKVTVVYNGIDVELFAPTGRAGARAQLGLEGGRRYVLYVGPLFGFRRTMLLETLKYLDPDVRVLAVWPMSDSELPESADDRLVRVGYVARQRMPMYYAAADVLAYPLVYTGFGLALLEASACGCVPVAFNVPPANEVVAETAWLVDEISPQAFGGAINAALADPRLPLKAEAGIRLARSLRFSRDRMVDETLAVYESVLRRRRRLGRNNVFPGGQPGPHHIVIRVVVLADTHLRTAPPGAGTSRRLPEAAWTHLRGADAILHAGDILDAGVIDLLAEKAPVYAVLGNNDQSLVGALPVTRVVELGGVRIGMIHDSGPSAGRAERMRRRFPDADVVVFGHSHAPVDEIGSAGQLLFNPGSPTQRRAQPVHTLGELRIADRAVIDHRVIPLDVAASVGRTGA